jgi:hypothetical protein
MWVSRESWLIVLQLLKFTQLVGRPDVLYNGVQPRIYQAEKYMARQCRNFINAKTSYVNYIMQGIGVRVLLLPATIGACDQDGNNQVAREKSGRLDFGRCEAKTTTHVHPFPDYTDVDHRINHR